MSDLRSVQFDVRDRHGEVVSIASDIYINKYSVLSVDEKGIFWLYMVATISDLYLSLVCSLHIQSEYGELINRFKMKRI